MTRLLRKTGEWCGGSDGNDYQVNTYYEIDWETLGDTILHCNRLNIYYETQGRAVALTWNNTFKIISTGVELFRRENGSFDENKRLVMSHQSRMLLSR